MLKYLKKLNITPEKIQTARSLHYAGKVNQKRLNKWKSNTVKIVPVLLFFLVKMNEQWYMYF